MGGVVGTGHVPVGLEVSPDPVVGIPIIDAVLLVADSAKDWSLVPRVLAAVEAVYGVPFVGEEGLCFLLPGSEDYGLCAWGGVGGEEEVAEDVVEAGDDDAVAGELGVL